MDPSASERLAALNQLQERRRRRGFLLGLLAGQILIIALDLGGALLLRLNPQVKIQAPISVAAIVFLGMAIGAALMIVAIALIAAVKRKGIFRTALSMAITIGVILGTAWFMIPATEWATTLRFARDKGQEAVDASTSRARSMFHAEPPPP